MEVAVENFSTYGTGSAGRTEMGKNPFWSELTASATPETTNPRGSGTHHLRVVTSALNPPRVNFGGALVEFFMAAGFSMVDLPDDNESQILFQPRDSFNVEQCTLLVSSTGTIQLKQGGRTGTLLAESDAPCIGPDSYYHVEAYFNIGQGSPSGGACEVRVNEATVLDVSGIDTQATSTEGASQAVICYPVPADGKDMDMADFDIRDVSGSTNNDFIGDVLWLRRDFVSDGAESDWVRNTGASDFSCIDDVAPDADTTYVAGANVADVSEFEIQDLPANTSEVVAVVIRTMARKIDAGTARYQASVVSSLLSPESEANGADAAVTLSYTYRDDIFETDPGTGVTWTPPGVNASRAKFEKTA